MFRIEPKNKLLICRKTVDDLEYKLGDSINDFLNKNLTGLNGNNFERIEMVEWSSDLSGVDEIKFIFNSGRLTKIDKGFE